MTIEPGSNVKGTVVKIADFGAIVRLGGGSIGLIHISEIADTFVRDVRDYLCEESEVTVKVLRVNAKGRYELSLKQCDLQPALSAQRGELVHAATRPPARSYVERSPSDAPKPPVTFEDRLSHFLKDSEQRHCDLKRHLDAKRGRR
jgi:S1 RNA binding domain protein